MRRTLRAMPRTTFYASQKLSSNNSILDFEWSGRGFIPVLIVGNRYRGLVTVTCNLFAY